MPPWLQISDAELLLADFFTALVACPPMPACLPHLRELLAPNFIIVQGSAQCGHFRQVQISHSVDILWACNLFPALPDTFDNLIYFFTVVDGWIIADCSWARPGTMIRMRSNFLRDKGNSIEIGPLSIMVNFLQDQDLVWPMHLTQWDLLQLQVGIRALQQRISLSSFFIDLGNESFLILAFAFFLKLLHIAFHESCTRELGGLINADRFSGPPVLSSWTYILAVGQGSEVGETIDFDLLRRFGFFEDEVGGVEVGLGIRGVEGAVRMRALLEVQNHSDQARYFLQTIQALIKLFTITSFEETFTVKVPDRLMDIVVVLALDVGQRIQDVGLPLKDHTGVEMSQDVSCDDHRQA